MDTQIQDMEISVSALQRWCYDYIPLENGQRTNSFRLLDTLPLQSMGDPETLVDFIRWGAENCPARKYALVLWDHGSGALSLCCDELFQDDVMYLYELRQALADSGVCLDTVIIDACLMANIETACAISDYAHWMVASEETVPGDGSAVSSWLQELIRHPALDGEWLGRCVCDKTEEKYANMDNELAGPLLTWSVTDLTKVSRVAEILDRFFQQIGELLANNPAIGKLYARYLSQTDQYGDDLVEYSKTAHLYNIPVQINSDKAVLRCQQTVMTSDARGTELDYYVYGVWLGYDENSMLMSRSVKPISMLQGQEFRLLYPVAGKGGNRDSYLSGKEMLLGRALLVKEIPLPAGTYYLEYELTDIFMRTMILDRIELYWDGQKFVLPDRLIWEGSVQPSWSR